MSVDLVPEWTIGDLCLTSYPFGVDADSTVDVGEPEMVVESVTSMLADGDLAQVSRYGNREYVLELYVEGPTLAELATAEASLRTELRRTGLTLTHDPGDGFSPASVYEVQTAQLTPQRNDTHESHLVRKFTLTLTCGPFARSADLTTVSSLVVGAGSEVVIDTCDSATGWTATVNQVPFGAPDPNWLGQAGKLFVYDLFNPGPQTMTMTRTGSFSVSTTPYIRVSIHADEPGQTTASAVVDGVSRDLTLVSQRKIGASDKQYEFVFTVPAGSVAVTSLTVKNYSQRDYASLGIAEVARLGAPGLSARQTSRVIEVGGTERTPASLRAFTSSGFLGQTLLHTTPYTGTGYTPDLRRWRISGNGTTTNSSSRKITGTWEAMQPASIVARVPSDQFPRGDYILMAAVKSSATGEQPISWAIKSLIDATIVGDTFGTAYYSFPVSDRLEYVPLGVVSAPVVRDEGRLSIEVHLSNPSPGTTTMHVEEWWMFTDGPDSALSIVGTDEANLTIESPDTSSAVPRVWVGTGSTRFHPNGRLIAQGTHRFPPGMMQVNAISDANDYLEVELSYYKRWHSNAAE